MYRQQSRPQTILNTHTQYLCRLYVGIKRQPWWPNRLYSSAARSFFQRNNTSGYIHMPDGIYYCARGFPSWSNFLSAADRAAIGIAHLCFLAIITWHLLDALWCHSRVWCSIERDSIYLRPAQHNRIIRNRVILIRFSLFEWYWIPGAPIESFFHVLYM